MIGFYDYTVILTYLSLVSAGLGITITLIGKGHPFLGTFFLLFCGLCDAFDGEIARSKKNRTEDEIRFGIQIDSLTDLVAFGVLPAIIGEAMIWQNQEYSMVPRLHTGNRLDFLVPILAMMVMMLYVLMAMIRLAYFNVMEEKRLKEEGGKRKAYTGLPVTSAALIFPFVMLLQFLTMRDLTFVYYGVMLIVGYLFVSRIEVRKPGIKGVVVLCLIGTAEFILMLILRSLAK